MKRILKRLASVSFVLLVLGAIFGGGYFLGTCKNQPVDDQIVLSAISDERMEQFTPLIQMFEIIKDQFYFELPSDEEMIEGAIQGMIDILPGEGAEFTYYFNPLQAKLNRAAMAGGFAGIGVRITRENGQTVVVSVEKDGPAGKGGIKPGDVLIAVDGESIEGIPWEIQSGLIRGEKGTTSTITVYRIGEGKLDLEVTRDYIATPSVLTRILGDGRVGYLSLEIFGETASQEVREALHQLLDEEGVEAIILDLRGNPGGGRDTGVQILSQFVSGAKPAAQIYTSDGAYYTLATYSGGIAQDIPLVVLIDQGSASSSELVAAALQDYGRAILIGDTTRGKGVGQTPIELPDGSLSMVVNHEFRSPKGNVIHGVGVQPDIRVPTSPAERQRGTDRALAKAVEVLLEQLDSADSTP